jgi:hypothetical protein
MRPAIIHGLQLSLELGLRRGRRRLLAREVAQARTEVFEALLQLQCRLAGVLAQVRGHGDVAHHVEECAEARAHALRHRGQRRLGGADELRVLAYTSRPQLRHQRSLRTQQQRCRRARPGQRRRRHFPR